MINKDEFLEILKEIVEEENSDFDQIIISVLKRLWYQRQNEINNDYSRTLSFGDYIVDRWEKAAILKFGKGSSIYDSSLVYGDVKVGENTWVGPFVILDGTGGIEIGSNCSISSGVHIYTHDTIRWAVDGETNNYEYKPVNIGDNCYIGPNTVITKGVTIGNKTIIGANSLVLTDIPSNSKAYGTPCEIVE